MVMLGDAVNAKKATGQAKESLEVIDVSQLLIRAIKPREDLSLTATYLPAWSWSALTTLICSSQWLRLAHLEIPVSIAAIMQHELGLQTPPDHPVTEDHREKSSHLVSHPDSFDRLRLSR